MTTYFAPHLESQTKPLLTAYFATFPPLEAQTKPLLTTKEYCHYLNFAEQTAWVHACKQNGPVRPVKVGRKLGWPTAAVKALCGVA